MHEMTNLFNELVICPEPIMVLARIYNRTGIRFLQLLTRWKLRILFDLCRG